MTYFADVVTLARKDLLLELRSRDTVPAMVLFVIAALVVFSFSVPADVEERASYGLLWIGLVFTALLGLTRAFAAEREQRVLDVYVQVDLGGPEGELGARGGAAPAEVPALADAVGERAELRLRGLMAVAPRGEDPAPAFARLAELAARVRAAHPGASELSAGMSADLEAAVTAGATVVRVGTALFGARPLASGEEGAPGPVRPRQSHQHHP